MMEAIKRILIADAGEDFRRGLVDSLSGEADIQVAGQTGDGAELVRMVSELMPDAVVMEIVLAAWTAWSAGTAEQRWRNAPRSWCCPIIPEAGSRMPLRQRGLTILW